MSQSRFAIGKQINVQKSKSTIYTAWKKRKPDGQTGVDLAEHCSTITFAIPIRTSALDKSNGVAFACSTAWRFASALFLASTVISSPTFAVRQTLTLNVLFIGFGSGCFGVSGLCSGFASVERGALEWSGLECL